MKSALHICCILFVSSFPILLPAQHNINERYGAVFNGKVDMHYFQRDTVGLHLKHKTMMQRQKIINGKKVQIGETLETTNLVLFGVSFTDVNNGTAVGAYGKILRMTNMGITWNEQTSGTITILNDVSFTDTQNGTAVGLSGTIFRTNNGGTTWNIQSSTTSQNLYGVCFTDALNGTVVGDYGTILRTTNSGTTWFNQSSGTSHYLVARICIPVPDDWN